MLHLEFNSESENEGIARIVTSAYIMRFDPDMEEIPVFCCQTKYRGGVT